MGVDRHHSEASLPCRSKSQQTLRRAGSGSSEGTGPESSEKGEGGRRAGLGRAPHWEQRPDLHFLYIKATGPVDIETINTDFPQGTLGHVHVGNGAGAGWEVWGGGGSKGNYTVSV